MDPDHDIICAFRAAADNVDGTDVLSVGEIETMLRRVELTRELRKLNRRCTECVRKAVSVETRLRKTMALSISVAGVSTRFGDEYEVVVRFRPKMLEFGWRARSQTPSVNLSRAAYELGCDVAEKVKQGIVECLNDDRRPMHRAVG